MLKSLIILSFFCLSSVGKTPQKILFVGNSLTYTNELPLMVKELGKAFGQKLKPECLCHPNYALEDHWNDGQLQDKIRNNGYEFVIFQQGPSSQAYGKTTLQKYGGMISDYARKFDAKPVYFMVWPSLRYYHTFDGVIANHTTAAQKNSALLAPLGKFWHEYRQTESAEKLYGPDGFHPSKAGSFFASLSIYKTMYPAADLSNLKYNRFSHLVREEAFKKMITMIEN